MTHTQSQGSGGSSNNGVGFNSVEKPLEIEHYEGLYGTSPCSAVGNSKDKCILCGAKNLPLQNTTREHWFRDQVINDPALIELLFSSTMAEVGGQGRTAIQAYMETVFNRAAANQKTLREILEDPKYYPDTTKNKLKNKVPENERANYQIALENVLAGSNFTNFATDNASAELAKERAAAGNPGVDIGGELFYVNKNGDGTGGIKNHADFYDNASCSL